MTALPQARKTHCRLGGNADGPKGPRFPDLGSFLISNTYGTLRSTLYRASTVASCSKEPAWRSAVQAM